MDETKQEDAYRIALSLGQLSGVQTGMLESIRHIHANLGSLKEDFDKKHTENAIMISTHLNDDQRKFDAISERMIKLETRTTVIWVLGIILFGALQFGANYLFSQQKQSDIVREVIRERETVTQEQSPPRAVPQKK